MSLLAPAFSGGRSNRNRAPLAPNSAAPIARPLVQVGHAVVWFTVFLSFFVLREPAPYELLGVAIIGTSFLFGMTIPRGVLPLLGLLILYVIGGFIGATLDSDFGEARFQILVTAFLAATSFFFACYAAKDSVNRINLIANAWQCGAVLAATLGVIGYFNIAGTGELLTLYGRAKSTFKDPNVFGPYIAGAIVFAYYRILTTKPSRWLFPLFIIGGCALGLLLSFSRGAWGYCLFAAGVVTFLQFALTPRPAERLRIIVLVMMGIALIAVGLIAAFSIPAIGDLLTQRASLIQDYDGGELGRFGRQVIGFQLSIENPFGIGTFGFVERFDIAPHNVYLNALLAHGWMGFFAYFVLVFLTAIHLAKVVLYNPPFRQVAIPLLALFSGLMLMGTFIDTDRWRHFFLLLGLSWGVISASIMEPYRPGRPRHSG